MDKLEKAELTASIRHVERFLKSGILIYISEVPDTAGRKTRRRRKRRRRSQVVAKYYAFHENTVRKYLQTEKLGYYAMVFIGSLYMHQSFGCFTIKLVVIKQKTLS